MGGGGGFVKLGLEDALERLRDNDQTLTHLTVGGSTRSRIGEKGARSIAEALKSNDKLRGLDLSWNGIGAEGARAIADALEANGTLRELNLTGNEFGAEGARAIAEALKANGVLKELNLHINDNEIGEDRARSIANALTANDTLQGLDLRGNEIEAGGARAIADALRAKEKLKELDLSYNGIGVEGARAIADALRANDTLEKLDLVGNKIGADEARAIADALETNETLKKLNLTGNEIDPKGASAIADALKANDTLEELDLKYNSIGDEGARAIAKALEANGTLLSLDLGHNRIGNKGARAMADALKANKTLSKLKLQENKIGGKGARAIANALKVNETLRKLSLWCNKINDAGVRAITKASKANGRLEELNLVLNLLQPVSCPAEFHQVERIHVAKGDGEIYVNLGLLDALERLVGNDQTLTHLKVQGWYGIVGEEKARAIAEALNLKDELNGLELFGEKIGDKGARAIAEALKKNYTLKALKLGGNEIGVEGASAIAEALRQNDTLKELELSGNKIGNKGAHAIAEALKEDSTLSKLVLGGNKIGTDGARAIANALQENGALKELDLYWNEVGTEGAQAIAQALETNDTLSKLNLGKNSISVEGARQFASFRVNNTLADLGWEGNGGVDIIERMRQYKDEFEEKGKHLYFDINANGSVSGIKNAAWDAVKGDYFKLSFVHLALQSILNKDNKKDVKKLLDGTRSPTGSPLLHLVADLDSDEAFELCKFLVIETGADFDEVVDKLGRTARQIAEGNKRTTQWARSVGTFLGRYLIEREGLYESATCRVDFAVDVTKSRGNEDRNVAIKIMNNEDQFKRELEHRLGENKKHAASGEDILHIWNVFDAKHAVRLLRYHEGEKGGEHRCLVMPQGERNLDEVIRYEGIAGKDIDKILYFAKDQAEALQHLHQKGVVHGDFKPRNIVRIHADYKLIDFDASVHVAEPLTEKFSSGYLAPEVAQVKFRPDENLEDLQAQLEKLKREIRQAEESEDCKTRRMKDAERGKVEEKMEQIESSGVSASGETNCSADKKMDVWSYGAVLFEMLTGTSLFRYDNNDNLDNEEEERKLVSWSGIPEDKLNLVLKDCTDQELVQEAKELLSKCLCTKDGRLESFHQVLALPFFSRKPSEARIIEKMEDGNKKVIEGQQEMTKKLDRSLKILSELQTQLMDVTKILEEILPDTNAPKLMCIVPEEKSIKDWMNPQNLLLKKVKVVFVCPVCFGIARNEDNMPMGYIVTLTKEWVKKCGPALKVSFQVLQIAFAAGRMAGLPFPNLSSIGKDTNLFSVLKDNLDVYIPKDDNGKSKVPDLTEMEAMVGDKATITIPSTDDSLTIETTEGAQIIKASYKQVEQIAKENKDPEFLQTGLVRVEKDGDSKDCEYVLDDPKIKALYKQKGRECIGPVPDIGLSVSSNEADAELDPNAVMKEGELKSKIPSCINRPKKAYIVLRRNGILIHYNTQKERNDDVYGLLGKHPKKVAKIVADNNDENRFRISYEDNKSNSFQCSDRDEVEAWVEAWSRIGSRSEGAGN